MALTPDDVVAKQFQHVRFKEGFDPDEVDDFLDEIVVEWRATIAENEELKAKLAQYESGELVAAASAESALPEPVAAAPVVAAPVVEAPVVEAPVVEAPAPTGTAAVSSTATIIDLAQRLHDEHIAEGVAQRDRLIGEAEEKATRIVADAEAKGREELARLEIARNELESRISDLQDFERSYRSQLRTYIEDQLKELESTAAAGSTPAAPTAY